MHRATWWAVRCRTTPEPVWTRLKWLMSVPSTCTCLRFPSTSRCTWRTFLRTTGHRRQRRWTERAGRWPWWQRCFWRRWRGSRTPPDDSIDDQSPTTMHGDLRFIHTTREDGLSSPAVFTSMSLPPVNSRAITKVVRLNSNFSSVVCSCENRGLLAT